MVHLILGGSGSGKSSYAESLAVKERSECHSVDPIIYLATMISDGPKSDKRIARHRELREGKNFKTLECPGGINYNEIQEGSIVVLEDIPNFLANIMFSFRQPGKDPVKVVVKEIQNLSGLSFSLLLVSDEVFSDGYTYDQETELYRKNLGMINKTVAAFSDHLTEIVYGIPIEIK